MKGPSRMILFFLCGCPAGPTEKSPVAYESADEDTETGSTESDTGACVTQTWYLDLDGDGYGDPGEEVSVCNAPDGYVGDAHDCNDANSDVYSGAPEICLDGLINDCDDIGGLAAAAACPLDGPYRVASADGRLLGEADGDFVGSVLASAGDVDGDGHDDLLVGAPYAGVAYRVMGPVSGAISLGVSATRVTDPGLAGWSVANAGDQDGDGFPDMLVGVQQGGEARQGQALLVLGTNVGDLTVGDVDAVLSGESEDDFAGQSVAGIGDMDGDGWDDLAVGAVYVTGSSVDSTLGDCATADREEYSGEYGISAGAVYLLRGPVSGDMSLAMADARVVGEDGADYLGYRLGGQGDLNGDGVPDLLMSAIGQCEGGLDAGAIYVMNGPVSGDLSAADADRKVLGSGRRELAGQVLSVAGDVNGDGYGDFVVGNSYGDGPEGGHQGVAWLIFGPGTGVSELAAAEGSLWGEMEASNAGASVASAGDTNRDGFDDLLVGASGDSTEATYGGAAYLVHGPITGYSNLSGAAAKFNGSESLEHVGSSVAGGGDVDGDGLLDLWIGAIGDSEAAHWAGAVSLILGGGPMLTGGYGP